VFDLSVYYMYLQYFDTVGWVFWPKPILCWRGRKTLLNPISQLQLWPQYIPSWQIISVFQLNVVVCQFSVEAGSINMEI